MNQTSSPMNLRLALSTAVAAVRMLRSAGLVFAVSPVALGRFARSVARRGWRGNVMALHLHALAGPLRPATVSLSETGETRLSYGELDARINRAAHGLRRHGVGPGDRVAVLLRNGHEHIELNAACAWLGATTVPIGYRLKAPEIAYILEHSGARVLVFHGDLAPAVEDALAAAGTPARADCIAAGGAPRFTGYDDLLASGDPVEPPILKAESHGGLMIYTSGTTGRPKGARRDHKENHLETVIHFMSQLPIRHDERHLVVSPMYHSGAAALTAINLSVGGCLVMLDHFDPERVLATIERERITSAFMVPTMLSRLVELGLPAIRRHDLSSLRWLLSGAAPLPTEVARRVEEAFGPVLYNFYGATETGFVTIALPGEHTARPGTIGRLVPGNEARLLDDAGRDVPDGQVGELYIRSRMLMAGYHGDDDATRRAARDGFISVGDLAWRDGDGYYYLAERKNDMVISGGVNIYPLEIEQRLHEHPAVADVAVVGVPDPDWGESLAAFVVLRPGMSAGADELRAHVAATLADYKKPRRFEFVDALPRTATGKVLKRALRERLLS